MMKTRSERERVGFDGVERRRAAAVWPRPKRRRKEAAEEEGTARLKREGKLAVKMGSQRWSEAMEMDHDLHTHDAVARLLGSRCSATRTSTSHGGDDGGDGEEEENSREGAMRKKNDGSVD